MEDKHLARLKSEFRGDLRHKQVHVLDIPDDYRAMDPDLVALLASATTPLIDAWRADHAARQAKIRGAFAIIAPRPPPKAR